MRLSKIKAESITRAHHISFSQNFVICCTKGSISVLDRVTLNLLMRITGVSHIKKAIVSPNEKWVLILSRNEAFYILSLENYVIMKYNISVEDDCIESPCGSLIKGYWSFDSKSIFILIDCYSRATNTSALRQYNFNEALQKNITFADMAKERYYFCDATLIPEMNKYLILGIDRTKQNQNRADCYTLIIFDGQNFEEHPLPAFYDMSPSYIDYDKSSHKIVLSATYGARFATFESINGEILRIEDDTSLKFKCNIDDQKIVDCVLNSAGCERADVHEIIQSENKPCYYISSQKGLIIVDKDTLNVVARIRAKHGILKTVEFGNRYIGVLTLDGLRVYEMVDE